MFQVNSSISNICNIWNVCVLRLTMENRNYKPRHQGEESMFSMLICLEIKLAAFKFWPMRCEQQTEYLKYWDTNWEFRTSVLQSLETTASLIIILNPALLTIQADRRVVRSFRKTMCRVHCMGSWRCHDVSAEKGARVLTAKSHLPASCGFH